MLNFALIALLRYSRSDDDSEQRTFELCSTAPTSVVNSTEIRFTQIELDPVRQVLPLLRRNPHRSGVLRHGQDAEVNRLKQFTLPVVTEQHILNGCW